MTRPELINKLFEETGVKKADLKEILDTLANVIKKEAVRMGDGEKVVLTGIVTIKKRLVPEKPARMGRNPQTGEAVRIPKKGAHMDLKARIDKHLKDAVLGKRAKKK
jgi:DNA-binding protein HU-beta